MLDVVLILLSFKIFAAKSAKFSSRELDSMHMDSTDPCTLCFRVFYEYGKSHELCTKYGEMYSVDQ